MKGAFFVKIGLLAPDPTQPRRAFDKEQLQELTASVREGGIRQPIRVLYIEASGTYRIIAGERRYRAAVAAGLSEVPCIIADKQTGERDVLLEQVIENWQRADLEPVEVSNALARLRDEHGMSQEEIARTIGKSKGEVSKLLAIQRVDASILKEAKEDRTGRFNRRTLVAIAGLSSDGQKEMVERVRHGMPVREVERVAGRLRKQGRGKRVSRVPGAIRRFVVGSAIVEVRFRKQDATNGEIADTLRRAAKMAEEAT